jgi:hypothetical protein
MSEKVIGTHAHQVVLDGQQLRLHSGVRPPGISLVVISYVNEHCPPGHETLNRELELRWKDA